jgi:hypothetical protein
MDEKANPFDAIGASITRSGTHEEQADARGFYTVECLDADGNVKWTDTIENLVVTQGRNFALDTVLSGSAYTAAWFMGLVDGASAPTYAAGDTMASHAGWTESTAYSNANRPTPAFAAASGASKATSAAVSFTINATATIAGCFLTTSNTKGGTTGTLYSAGSFSGGNRAVVNGDTLNVTYTASL